MKQLTINKMQDIRIFAKRKSSVNGQWSNVNGSSGFTLVEMIIYIAFFAMLSVLAINATIMVMKSFYTLRINQSISQSATTALERMSREIRNAYNIDTANSTLGTSPGRLTLMTKDDLGALTTVEFYNTAGNQVNMKVGGVDQGSLMTKTVTATNLVFHSMNNGTATTTNSKAVKIEMTLTDNRSGISKTVKYYDTLVLRGSMH